MWRPWEKCGRGGGKGNKSLVMVTLGTGVGGGIVIGGRLFEGGSSAGTEIGHTVIETNGYPCTCGRWGCFECYASATALMRKTKDAMEEDTGSEMWKTYTPQTVSGKTPFEYAETDIAAKQVVDWYVKHLACGITNLANVFRPQVVMLGGGVSEQGERLTVPVQRLVDKELFAGTDFAPVKVVKASLGSRAGAVRRSRALDGVIMKYDYLIVGAGLFGATFAHEAVKKGKKCLVVEKRAHIGGNVYRKVRGYNRA